MATANPLKLKHTQSQVNNGFMINTNDVFRKIKEMSKTMANPRPQILINDLANELSIQRDQVLPSLAELKHLRLIQSDPITNASVSIKLTLLGFTVNR